MNIRVTFLENNYSIEKVYLYQGKGKRNGLDIDFSHEGLHALAYPEKLILKGFWETIEEYQLKVRVSIVFSFASSNPCVENFEGITVSFDGQTCMAQASVKNYSDFLLLVGACIAFVNKKETRKKEVLELLQDEQNRSKEFLRLISELGSDLKEKLLELLQQEQKRGEEFSKAITAVLQ